MALFDKLKDAATKAKEAATKVADVTSAAVAKGKDFIEQNKPMSYNDKLKAQIENQYQQTMQEIAEKRQAEEARKEEKKEKYWQELMISDCELGVGDCCWLSDTFYCTCGDDVDCPRKKYVKTKQQGKMYNIEHYPYIKYLSKFKEEYDSCTESMQYTSLAPCTMPEIIKAFLEKFLPEHVGGFGTTKSELDYFYKNGLGTHNPLIEILFTVHDATDGTVGVPDFFALVNMAENGVDLRQPFFKNPSLYDRSMGDMEYTARVLDTVHNPEKAARFYKDPCKLNLEELYNADGTIKEAGRGGPKNGHYGDVIYNIIESWSEKEE